MKIKKFLKISLISLLVLFVVGISAILIYTNIVLKPVKNLDLSLNQSTYKYSELYSINGDKINIDAEKNSNYITLDNINDETKMAFISIEDKNFYKHKGLNYKRIVKATLNNLKSKDLVEGASTITQQLVKNRYLNQEKTFDRKIKEAYLALKLEKCESKDKILETYLNTIYYGNGAYGIGNASQRFFNKDPNELTLSESCILAGAIKSPSNYSPINNLDKCIERRNLVLSEMLKDGLITDEEYNEAINEEVVLNENIDILKSNFDLYTQFALNEASDILNTNINNILNGGYKIYTYQNLDNQKLLDEVISNEENYHKNSYGNIADSLALIIDNKTFGVIAVSGKSEYNLVDIKRQPGSLIKPVMVYAPAMEEGIVSPITRILDEEIDYNGYSPKNVGNVYHGYVSVKDAVSKSLNIPAVKVCEKVGLEKCKQYAEKSGITFAQEDVGYALALGGFTDGVTLQEITDAYIPFVNNGNFTNSSFISKIVNRNGITLYDNKLSESKVYNDDTCCLMTDTLKYSVKNGTSKKLAKLNFDVAGKTGTVAVKGTNLNTDAYSLAYTNDHIMSVWLGNYTMQSEFNLEGSNNGGTYATKMILDTFEELYKDNIPANFEQPESVVECNIDIKTLNEDHVVVLGDNIPERYQVKELFSKRFLPTNNSNKFNTIEPFEIKTNTLKNSCEISFDAYDYIEYELYKKINNKSILLDKIKNKNDSYKYIDTDIDYNTKYNYYVIAKNLFSDNVYTTSPKQIILEKDYEKLIENETDNLNWLFG